MMKYTFSDGEQSDGSRAAMEQKARELQRQIDDYLELDGDLDSDAYVARGNGFCDAKYSENFVEGQIAKLQKKLAECKKFLSLHP